MQLKAMNLGVIKVGVITGVFIHIHQMFCNFYYFILVVSIKPVIVDMCSNSSVVQVLNHLLNVMWMAKKKLISIIFTRNTVLLVIVKRKTWKG